MTATDVLTRYGTWALVKFTAALLLFLTLHLVRLPVRLVVIALDAAAARIDTAVTGSLSRPAPHRTEGHATP